MNRTSRYLSVAVLLHLGMAHAGMAAAFMVPVAALEPVGKPAQEQPQQEQKEARAALKSGAIIPYAKLKKAIEQKTGGRIIGQRLRKTGAGWVYELRLRMKKGKIQYIRVDGATGTITKR